MKCLHENYDEYFERCSDCNADTKIVVKDNFQQELQGVYSKMLQVMGELSGDIELLQLQAMTEAEDKLAEIVADWLVNKYEKEEVK